MKFIKRLFSFVMLILVYFVLKEFLFLYNQLSQLHEYAGYGFLIILAGVLIYFVAIPVIKIIKIPRFSGPVKNKEDEPKLISERMERFRNNPYLQEMEFDFSDLQNDEESYKLVTKVLEKRCNQLRKRHVSQMFYSTSIAQNGFLDAMFIISGSINHVKEIFLLYNGRVSNRDLWGIARRIYYSMAIGGSEGVEYTTEELVNRFASDSLKSIPFIDKILSSVADGLVNATLLTRISYITERYCKLTYIKNERDLYPSPQFILNSARHITADIIDRIAYTIKKMAVEKTANFAQVAINPVGYVLGQVIEHKDSLSDDKKIRMKDHARLVGNPIAYGVEKLFKSLKKK